MPSDHPQTPQSPSQSSFVVADLPGKTATSPQNSHSLPTPAHSINGSMSSLLEAGMDTSSEEQSNKRKRDIEDHGDRDMKKIHTESSRLNIEDLHLDVGTKFLLCRKPHRPLPCPVDEDLFARYDMHDIVQTVARTNPDGSKGVKLRKTYKNQIKDYGLSGAFNPVRNELMDPKFKDKPNPKTMTAMISISQAEWEAEHKPKGIGKELPAESLAILGRACTMAMGRIPSGKGFDEAILALPAAKAKEDPPPLHVAKVSQNGNRTPLHNAPVARTAKTELPRPKRNIKKRTYGDSSFDGYGEGYVDDDQDIGYSTGDGEERSSSRKRPKKNTAQHGFQNTAMRQNSYGPGMVGA